MHLVLAAGHSSRGLLLQLRLLQLPSCYPKSLKALTREDAGLTTSRPE